MQMQTARVSGVEGQPLQDIARHCTTCAQHPRQTSTGPSQRSAHPQGEGEDGALAAARGHADGPSMRLH